MTAKLEAEFNIITFGKKLENFERTINTGIIGSALSTVDKHIQIGNIALLHWKGYIWGYASISSKYFFSEEPIWKDKLYPHRFCISNLFLTKEPFSLSNGIYNSELRKAHGTGWAYKFIFSPKPLPKNIGEDIYEKLKTLTPLEKNDFSINHLQEILDSLK